MEEKIMNFLGKKVEYLKNTEKDRMKKIRSERKLDVAYETLQKNREEALNEIKSNGAGSQEASLDIQKIDAELEKIKEQDMEIATQVVNDVKDAQKDFEEMKKIVSENQKSQKKIEEYDSAIEELIKYRDDAKAEIEKHNEKSQDSSFLEAKADLERIEKELAKKQAQKERAENKLNKSNSKVEEIAYKHGIGKVVEEKKQEELNNAWDEAIKENEEYDIKKLEENLEKVKKEAKSKFNKDWDSAIKENKEFDAKKAREIAKKRLEEELEEAIKENEEFDKRKKLVEELNNAWDSAIKENKEFDAKKAREIAEKELEEKLEKARKEQEELAKKKQEEQNKKEQEEKAKKEQEELARKEQEELAKKLQEEQNKKEQEEKAKKEQEELAKKLQEEQNKKEQEEKAKKEKEELSKKMQEELERKEREEKAKKLQEEIARKEQEEKEEQEAVRKVAAEIGMMSVNNKKILKGNNVISNLISKKDKTNRTVEAEEEQKVDKIEIEFNAKQDTYSLRLPGPDKSLKLDRKELKKETLDKEGLAEVYGIQPEYTEYVDEYIEAILKSYDEATYSNETEKYIKLMTTVGKSKQEKQEDMKASGLQIKYDLKGLFDTDKSTGKEKDKFTTRERYEILQRVNKAKARGTATVKKGFVVTVLEPIDKLVYKISLADKKKLPEAKIKNENPKRKIKKQPNKEFGKDIKKFVKKAKDKVVDKAIDIKDLVKDKLENGKDSFKDKLKIDKEPKLDVDNILERANKAAQEAILKNNGNKSQETRDIHQIFGVDDNQKAEQEEEEK